MSTTVVTQRSEFECAYIMSINGRPPQLHAHHYRIEFSVCGEQRFKDHGIVIEFEAFKPLIQSILPDHKFLYSELASSESAEVQVSKVFEAFGISTQGCYFAISAENLLSYLVSELQAKLDCVAPGVHVVDAKLRESTDSYTSWSRD